MPEADSHQLDMRPSSSEAPERVLDERSRQEIVGGGVEAATVSGTGRDRGNDAGANSSVRPAIASLPEALCRFKSPSATMSRYSEEAGVGAPGADDRGSCESTHLPRAEPPQTVQAQRPAPVLEATRRVPSFTDADPTPQNVANGDSVANAPSVHTFGSARAEVPAGVQPAEDYRPPDVVPETARGPTSAEDPPATTQLSGAGQIGFERATSAQGVSAADGKLLVTVPAPNGSDVATDQTVSTNSPQSLMSRTQSQSSQNDLRHTPVKSLAGDGAGVAEITQTPKSDAGCLDEEAVPPGRQLTPAVEVAVGGRRSDATSSPRSEQPTQALAYPDENVVVSEASVAKATGEECQEERSNIRRSPRKDKKNKQSNKKTSKLKEHETNDGEDDQSDESDEEPDDKRDENHTGLETVEKSPLGRFLRFSNVLGSGSYKTVYLGFDSDTGKEIAWNVIKFQGMQKHERKRITEEINMLKSLKHDRILSFINAWINKKDEQVCFITERVTDGSLMSYIKRIGSPMRVKVIGGWSLQILDGINYLHTQENPVIHRDLKCENIFINGNRGEIFIGDLGLSTTLRQSIAASIVGTPAFMAPELYEEKYGTEVDIYAFGMCLLEMTSRGAPYNECSSTVEVYKKVIAGAKPRVLRQIKDDALRTLIDLCLSTDPRLRPTAAALQNDQWFSPQNPMANQFCDILNVADLPQEDRFQAPAPAPTLDPVPEEDQADVEAQVRKEHASEPPQELQSRVAGVTVSGVNLDSLQHVPRSTNDAGTPRNGDAPLGGATTFRTGDTPVAEFCSGTTVSAPPAPSAEVTVAQHIPKSSETHALVNPHAGSAQRTTTEVPAEGPDLVHTTSTPLVPAPKPVTAKPGVTVQVVPQSVPLPAPGGHSAQLKSANSQVSHTSPSPDQVLPRASSPDTDSTARMPEFPLGVPPRAVSPPTPPQVVPVSHLVPTPPPVPCTTPDILTGPEAMYPHDMQPFAASHEAIAAPVPVVASVNPATNASWIDNLETNTAQVTPRGSRDVGHALLPPVPSSSSFGTEEDFRGRCEPEPEWPAEATRPMAGPAEAKPSLSPSHSHVDLGVPLPVLSPVVGAAVSNEVRCAPVQTMDALKAVGADVPATTDLLGLQPDQVVSHGTVGDDPDQDGGLMKALSWQRAHAAQSSDCVCQNPQARSVSGIPPLMDLHDTPSMSASPRIEEGAVDFGFAAPHAPLGHGALQADRTSESATSFAVPARVSAVAPAPHCDGQVETDLPLEYTSGTVGDQTPTSTQHSRMAPPRPETVISEADGFAGLQEPEPELTGPSQQGGLDPSADETLEVALASIGRTVVTKVQLEVINEKGRKTDIWFDFDPNTDTLTMVAQELRSCSLANNKPMEALISEIQTAVIRRCQIMTESTRHEAHQDSPPEISQSGNQPVDAEADQTSTPSHPAPTPPPSVAHDQQHADSSQTGPKSACSENPSVATVEETGSTGRPPELLEGPTSAQNTPEEVPELGEDQEQLGWVLLGWDAANLKHPKVSAETVLAGDANVNFTKEISLLQKSLTFVTKITFKQVGSWCDATSNAVENFQDYHKLTNERGVVDDKFWEILSAEVRKREAKDIQKKETQRKAQREKEARKQAQASESKRQLDAMMGNCERELVKEQPAGNRNPTMAIPPWRPPAAPGRPPAPADSVSTSWPPQGLQPSRPATPQPLELPSQQIPPAPLLQAQPKAQVGLPKACASPVDDGRTSPSRRTASTEETQVWPSEPPVPAVAGLVRASSTNSGPPPPAIVSVNSQPNLLAAATTETEPLR